MDDGYVKVLIEVGHGKETALGDVGPFEDPEGEMVASTNCALSKASPPPGRILSSMAARVVSNASS